MVVRGMGGPITIREALTFEESEYPPDQNTVRYVADDTAQGPVEGSTRSVGEHAHRECLNVGAEAVRSAIREWLDSPLENISIRPEFDDDDTGEKIVVVYTVSTAAWERAVKRTPNIDFDDLVAVTPQRVRTTVELEGVEYSCDIPVFIRTTEASRL